MTEKVPLDTLFHFSEQSEAELTYLECHKHKPITVKDGAGAPILNYTPPKSGWTLKEVRKLEIDLKIRHNVYDVFLADEWIGSSEM